MRVALYCRVSTEEQAKRGESIVDQLQALREWAKQNGHIICGEYLDEGYSAHKAYKSRPQLMEMLAELDNIDVIAFTKFDRWTRKAADYYKLQDILDKRGVAWKAILEDYETITSDGRFKVGIMLSVNQHEAERTSDRIKFTFAEKRKRGEIISGNMPRGYVLVDGKPQKDPQAADAMQAFFDTYLQGKGLKAAQLAAYDKGLSIEGSNASFYLRNARNYTGTIQGVKCEPYITVAQAELILSTRKSAPRKTECVFLFSGLIACAECGGKFGAHRNFYKHSDGTRCQQIFYNCTNRHRKQPYGCANHNTINENIIERYMLAELGVVLDDMAVKAEIRINTHPSAENAAERIVRLEKRKERAITAYLDGLMSKERLKAEQDSIEAEIAKLKTVEKEKTPSQIRAILPQNWREIYNALSVGNKREFWFRTIERIEIDKERNINIVPRV